MHADATTSRRVGFADVLVAQARLSAYLAPTPLHHAVAAGRADIVALLLDKGAPIDAKRSKNASTPLLMALADRQADTAKLLLERGADPNVRTNDGQPALLMALQLKERGDVLGTLLAHDAMLDVVDRNGAVTHVKCSGVPPQMFRENIGVVVEGTMTEAGHFESRRLMVSHSNEYRVPGDPAKADMKEVMKTTEGLER